MLKNSLLFPAIQSVHLVGIALFVGTTVLVDLRTLGFGLRRHVESSLAGLVVMLITGPILFLSDAPRYLANPAFLVKMALLTLALAFHFTIHRKHNRPAALLSMILWSCVVIGGRAIADFDV
ncbi:MAG TPA: hypothetical protein VE422_04345 [Terriglobia bacterium]|nr:hypothetical protein [Terriglobia bacterium]